MKLEIPFESGICDIPGTDIRYYGEDAKEFLRSSKLYEDINLIGKDCITEDGDEGIIIGIEDSESFMDYYFITFIPSKEIVKYELANNPEFYKNIKQ